MTATRIKICGMTRPEDAQAAAEAGADAIGMVFYGPSPRNVTLAQAAEIAAAVGPFVNVVALFVDEPAEVIERILAQVPVDTIQFHGDETAEFCAQFGRSWLKTLRLRPGMDAAAEAQRYRGAQAILLDTWQEGVPGGTGKVFDWRLADCAVGLPVILAGGLDDANVGDGIAALRPAAVDVSSGVERSPGIKNADKIRRFVSAVRTADQIEYGQIDDK